MTADVFSKMGSIGPLWMFSEIQVAAGATAASDQVRTDHAVFGLQIDSRDVAEGDLFIAMPGTNLDGHQFVERAFAQGAVGALVRHDWPCPKGVEESRLIRCDCPKKALIALAIYRRAHSCAVRIGVTGSVGKTGMKDALHRCLGREAIAHTNVRSFNNDVGVPLTMARMPREAAFAIFEMGMNHAGELTVLSDLVRPHIAMITTVALAHAEAFDQESDIAHAKAEIFTSLEPGGTAILPKDNAHFAILDAAAQAADAKQILTFGATDVADAYPLTVKQHVGCSTVSAQIGETAMLFKIGQPGAHWITNALACLLAVDAAGGDMGLAGLALAEMQPLPGRGQVLGVPVGAGTATLIDDSYNANPASMAAAIQTFRSQSKETQARKIALLGDMLELGDIAKDCHEAILPDLIDADVDLLIAVGPHMADLAAVSETHFQAISVPDHIAALKALRGHLRAGDMLLVKGSNGIGLGKIVSLLKAGEFALTDVRPSAAGGRG